MTNFEMVIRFILSFIYNLRSFFSIYYIFVRYYTFLKSPFIYEINKARIFWIKNLQEIIKSILFLLYYKFVKYITHSHKSFFLLFLFQKIPFCEITIFHEYPFYIFICRYTFLKSPFIYEINEARDFLKISQ